jgi:hypothetical protein
MSFADDLNAITLRIAAKLDTDVRRIVAGIAESVIEMSPVGDPEFWAINDLNQFKRDSATAWAAENGRKAPSQRTLLKQFPMRSVGGYVGGRFRANWDYGLDSAPGAQYDVTDKTPATSMNRVEGGLKGAKMAGHVHYIANNLPYAQRLEDGHSRQAPNGMVGLTVQRFDAIVSAAVK